MWTFLKFLAFLFQMRWFHFHTLCKAGEAKISFTVYFFYENIPLHRDILIFWIKIVSFGGDVCLKYL